MKKLIIVTAIIMLASCATVKQSALPAEGNSPRSVINKTVSEAADDQDHLILATLWFQKSAEMRALYYQCFRNAEIALAENLAWSGRTRPAAVVLDIDETLLDNLILRNWPRAEKIAVKDVKIRTFIGQENWRNQLASHVYDVSYGTVRPDNVLVCVDDSIVRGTTLRKSILRMLSRLNPRKIAIVSTAPQIRYPDCYGIDMSELGKFIAFEAAITLLKERGQSGLIDEVYRACVAEVAKPAEEQANQVRRIYAPFTAEEISAKIAEFVRPRSIAWQGEIEIIYQTVENLHAALPNHTGDWFFTGHYPTPGGTRVANQAFINYYEKAEGRSY